MAATMTRSTRFSELHTRLNIVRGPAFIGSITDDLTALENAPSNEEQRPIADRLRGGLSESLERYHPQNTLHDLIFDIQIFLARYWPININDRGEIEDFKSHEIITEAELDGDGVIPLSSGHLFHRQTLKRYYLSAHSYVWINGRRPRHPFSNDDALSERDQRELSSKNIFPSPPRRDANQIPPDHRPELLMMIDRIDPAAVDEDSPHERAGISTGLLVGLAVQIAIIAFCPVIIPLWVILPISTAVGAINVSRNLNNHNEMPSLVAFGYGFFTAYGGSIVGAALASLAVKSVMAVLTVCAGAAAVASISAALTAALPFVPFILFAGFSIAEYFSKNAMKKFFTAILWTPIIGSVTICRYVGKGLDTVFNRYRQYGNNRQEAENREERQPAAQVFRNAAQIQQGLGIEQAIRHDNNIPEAAVNNLPEHDILFPWGHRAAGFQPAPDVRQAGLGY